MLSLDKDKHRPCEIKGSSCIELQVDVEAFWHLTTQEELLKGLKGQRSEHPLRSKAKT